MGDPAIQTEKIFAGRRLVLDHQGDVFHQPGDLGRKRVQGLLDPRFEPFGLFVEAAGQGASAGSTSSIRPVDARDADLVARPRVQRRARLPDLAVDLDLAARRQRRRGLAERADERLDADLRLPPPAPADPDHRKADLPDRRECDCEHVPRGRQEEQSEDERDDQDQGDKYCLAVGLAVVIGRDGVHLIVTGSQHLEARERSTIPGMARGSELTAFVGVAPEQLSPPEGVEALAALYECGFLQGGLPTIGLEEELILVDRDSLQPVDAIESVLAASAGRALPGRVPGLTDRDRDARVHHRCRSVRRARGRATLPGRGAGRPGAPARRGHAPDLDAPGDGHRPAPLPRDRRGVPVDRPARHPERPPRPCRRRRARRGARGLQRGARLPARGRARSPRTRRSSRGPTPGSPRAA